MHINFEKHGRAKDEVQFWLKLKLDSLSAKTIWQAFFLSGRVLVHCFMGVSRSATCAIAFLMIKRGMTLTEAMALVRSRRDIHPNEGFIRQLQMLDRELRVSRVRWPRTPMQPLFSLSCDIKFGRDRVRSLDRSYSHHYWRELALMYPVTACLLRIYKTHQIQWLS